MSGAAPITVIETPEFLTATQKFMTEEQRAVLVDYLAHHPAAGDLIRGTGGVRKLRWALERRGKRGGARVVYFYHNAVTPLFALTAYAKNERADLSQKEIGMTSANSPRFWLRPMEGSSDEQSGWQHSPRPGGSGCVCTR